MEQALMRLLKPGTFLTSGMSLLVAAWMAGRGWFALALVSWLAGTLLMLRIHVRRHGGTDRRRTFFG